MIKMDKIENYINKPLKSTLTRDEETKSKYKLNIRKYGDKFNGITINLTEEQINQLYFWR